MKFKIDLRPAFAITTILGLIVVLTTSCSTCCKKTSAAPNTLTDQEKADGWKLLWDGKTTDGWCSPKSEEFPVKSWGIADGVLTADHNLTNGNAEAQFGGDIITRRRYANF